MCQCAVECVIIKHNYNTRSIIYNYCADLSVFELVDLSVYELVGCSLKSDGFLMRVTSSTSAVAVEESSDGSLEGDSSSLWTDSTVEIRSAAEKGPPRWSLVGCVSSCGRWSCFSETSSLPLLLDRESLWSLTFTSDTSLSLNPPHVAIVIILCAYSTTALSSPTSSRMNTLVAPASATSFFFFRQLNEFFGTKHLQANKVKHKVFFFLSKANNTLSYKAYVKSIVFF